MKKVNNSASHHDWWWMATGLDIDPLAPCRDLPSWCGQFLNEGITRPGTALEVAFQHAVQPLGQSYLTLAAPGGDSATPPGEPFAGDRRKNKRKNSFA